jgi:hypothetical protein
MPFLNTMQIKTNKCFQNFFYTKIFEVTYIITIFDEKSFLWKILLYQHENIARQHLSLL